MAARRAVGSAIGGSGMLGMRGLLEEVGTSDVVGTGAGRDGMMGVVTVRKEAVIIGTEDV